MTLARQAGPMPRRRTSGRTQTPWIWQAQSTIVEHVHARLLTQAGVQCRHVA